MFVECSKWMVPFIKYPSATKQNIVFLEWKLWFFKHGILHIYYDRINNLRK